MQVGWILFYLFFIADFWYCYEYICYGTYHMIKLWAYTISNDQIRVMHISLSSNINSFCVLGNFVFF